MICIKAEIVTYFPGRVAYVDAGKSTLLKNPKNLPPNLVKFLMH